MANGVHGEPRRCIFFRSRRLAARPALSEDAQHSAGIAQGTNAFASASASPDLSRVVDVWSDEKRLAGKSLRSLWLQDPIRTWYSTKSAPQRGNVVVADDAAAHEASVPPG